MSDDGVPDELAEYHRRRRTWEEKPQIRLVYERWVARMRPFLPDGPLLEVGSGSGLLRSLLPEVLLSDVVDLPWLDHVTDGSRLPFDDATLGGVLLLDTLHHVGDPHALLREAARALRPGGRVLLIEPYITPVSYLGYRLLHHEALDLRNYQPPRAAPKHPWDGNLAMANLVLGRDLRRWSTLQPDLAVVHRAVFSLFDFQLALGFKPRALVPLRALRWLARLDDALEPVMPLVGHRVFVVLERKARLTPQQPLR